MFGLLGVTLSSKLLNILLENKFLSLKYIK